MSEDRRELEAEAKKNARCMREIETTCAEKQSRHGQTNASRTTTMRKTLTEGKQERRVAFHLDTYCPKLSDPETCRPHSKTCSTALSDPSSVRSSVEDRPTS